MRLLTLEFEQVQRLLQMCWNLFVVLWPGKLSLTQVLLCFAQRGHFSPDATPAWEVSLLVFESGAGKDKN